MKKHATLWCIGLLAGFLLMAVVPGVRAENRFVVAVPNLPTTLDPHREASDEGISCLANVFDGLVQRLGPKASISPCLAERWEHPDPETWKFFLRRSVVFHNGNPLTADDVKFSLLRLSASHVPVLNQIGKSIDFINIVDPWSITVRTKSPAPWFLGWLPNVFIMDRESTIGRTSEEVAIHPVGTGAYHVAEWKPGTSLRLESNKEYWEGTPHADSVRFIGIPAPNERLDAVNKGAANLAPGIPIDLVPNGLASQHVEIASVAGRRSIFLSLGNRRGSPLADVRVRRAMYMAIDEDAIAEGVMNGLARVSSQVPDPYARGFNEEIVRLPHDSEHAKRLLTEAGYRDGFDISLSFPKGRYVRGMAIAQAVAANLGEIGIRVSVNPLSVEDFFQSLVEGALDFYLIGWSDGAFDMGRSYLMMGHSRGDGLGYLNGANFSSTSFDRLLATTLEMTDIHRRTEVLKQLSKMAMTDLVPWIPLHYEMDLYLVAKEPFVAFFPRPDRWIVCKEIFVGGANLTGVPPF